MSIDTLHIQEYKVSGEKLLARVKEFVHQGNIRRITIKNDDGMVLMELPLTLGVMGAVLLPVWVAVGAMAALAANYRFAVEMLPAKPAKVLEPPFAEAGHFHERPDV
jgi:hypothetical protein